MRVLGFLVVGMGVALAMTTALGLIGAIPLTIDFVGIDLDTRSERICLALGCVAVAIGGLVLLRLSRRSATSSRVRAT